MSEESIKRIGDYEILGVLGRGGMGKVFKVRNVISDRIEAMKVLLPDLAGRQELAERFLREIKLLASLDHPNIAALRTALTLNNQLVMVMEYVEGITLGERLEQGPIPAADAVNYTQQVLAALSYAHARNVIHRDIKPANMMLTPEGTVKLMDFGIARSSTDHGLTTAGTTLGSLYYMSPEQVKGEKTDARSDVYSLGVSLYEMATGQRPFRADSDYSMMAAHVQELPKPPIELRPDLPAALNEIILTAIAKEPGQRFQSADAFRNALNSLRGTMQPAFAVNQSALPLATPNPVAASATPVLQNAAAPISTNVSSTAPLEAPARAEAIPSVLQLAERPKTHRGLYMSLGALIVLVVLVMAGIYVPRKFTTMANEQTQGQQQKPKDSAPASSGGIPDADKTKVQDSADQSAQGTAQPAESKGQVPATGNDAGSKADNPGAKPAGQTEQISTPEGGKAKKKHTETVGSKVANTADAGQQDEHADQNAGSEPVAPAQLEELEQQADQLSSRVNSINDSLDNLRNQQRAQGFSLRRDVASDQELMKIHLAKAQAALRNHDATGTKKYLDLAEGDAARIDKFLGH